MESKELLRQMIVLTRRMGKHFLDQLQEHPMTFPTPKGGCHPTWIVGHISYGESEIVHSWILQKENPLAHWKELFDIGTTALEDSSIYPSFQELLQVSEKTHQELLDCLESFSESELDVEINCPKSMAPWFGTRRKSFTMAALHWTMHRGNLADSLRMTRNQ